MPRRAAPGLFLYEGNLTSSIDISGKKIYNCNILFHLLKNNDHVKEKTGWDWDGKVKDLASNSTDYSTWMYAIGVTGTAYLIYRGARMLISALPPLWWTLPANVAIP